MRTNLNQTLLSLACLVAASSLSAEESTSLFNGKDFEGWKLLTRKAEEGLGEKIFSINESGEIHIYRDFPDGYQLDGKKNDTHAIMVTEKSYQRYHFTWEYKWGTKKLNNFGKYQYDSGMFYHVQQAKVWPQGYEYQIRWDHRTNQNHTGDIWNCEVGFRWSQSENKTWLPVSQGGKPVPHAGGQHLAKPDVLVHALDGEWNQCEVIVMGNDFAIQKLNGVVVNVLTELEHDSGPIAMQAETAEIFYRNLKIQEFSKSLPLSDFFKEKPAK